MTKIKHSPLELNDVVSGVKNLQTKGKVEKRNEQRKSDSGKIAVINSI